MKKFRNTLLTVMTVMMTASCVEEIADPAYGEHELSFTASFDSDDDTKTILVDGKDVHWLPGDCISVSGASDAFVSDASAQCAVTTFTGSALPAETYYAVYPYEYVVSWNDEVASVNVPANQTAVKGTFFDDLNISASRTSSSDMNMSFHNVLGYMKFTISEDSGSIRSVEVSAIGGESLAGAAEISYDSQTGQPFLVSTTEFQIVTLSSESALEPGDYYIAMIPGTYSAGLTLIFTDSEGRIAEKTVASKLVLEPGKIQNIGAVSGLKFETTEQILARERAALVAIYNALNGDNWVNNENWCSNKPVGEWYGLTTNSDGLIVKMILYDNNLVGILPDDIGSLKYLTSLDLCGNKISGPLPDGLWNLTSLKELSLQSNKFNYELPEDIGKLINLNFFNYGHNDYVGHIPEGIGKLVKLTTLGLSGAEGDVPESIGNLSQLERLLLGGGKLTSLPSSIGKLSNLMLLDLDNNNLTDIPKEIGELRSLTDLRLDYNDIEKLPDEIGNMTSLTVMQLNDNHLSQLPQSIPNCSQLTALIVSNNNLTSLPDLSSCDNLMDFTFSGNEMIGTFPEWIFKHKNLKYSWAYNLLGNYLDISHSNIPAPEFVMKSIDGQDVVSDEVYRDHSLTILYEWAASNFGSPVFTDSFMQEVKDVYSVYKDKGLEIIGLCGASESFAEDVIEKYDLQWNNIVYSESDPWVCYCVNMATWYVYPDNSIPNITIVDNNGYVVWTMDISNISLMEFCADFYGDTESDYYTSTDYSADGEVTTLQTASEGNGVDIVLMGDAYSDRLIADGTYAADMKAMMDAFFSEEPYKSHKDCFNAYAVNVVSENEVYDEYTSTALAGWFGEGTAVGGDDNTCFTYGLNAISDVRMDEALIIVAMNSEAYAGTCYMYYPSDGDHSSGPAIAYFPVGSDSEQLAQLVHHEAGGHGFAKLADEYSYEEYGEMSQQEITEQYLPLEPYGWWKNVDFTDDLQSVKWSHFLEDERYDGEGLGVFEGACTYWTGAWRPTENSIMRHNTGGFNAPSREAIYYRIHKLAYGDSWEYDYEDFVEYDAVNRSVAASVARRQRVNYVERDFEPTAAPVVVGKSWKDAR